MADPFIGEIRIFAGNFAPRDWAFCNGQLVQIAQNPALFSILGTIYGGDGRNDFAVPNLEGRFPVHAGEGPGLTRRTVGQRSGNSTNTLGSSNLPDHTHTLQVSSQDGEEEQPANNRAIGISGDVRLFGPASNLTALSPSAIGSTGGGGAALDNRQPYLGLNFIIALAGTFPSRN